MGTLERTVTYKHEIGPSGKLTMKGVTGHLHVVGVDGDEARLRVVYRVRASDQATAERALDQGRVKVDRGPESLVVETPERRLSVGIAWLFGGNRVSVDLYAEVPFATRVNLETVSGSIEAARLSGEQRYRTISGEIRATAVGDSVSASTVSGAVYAEGLAGVRLNLQTVSGSVTARAPLFRDLRLSTTSGNIRVEGALAPGGSYKADSVSGLLELMTPSGVAAELKTLSWRINSEVDHRIQGGRGQWRAIVGDASADFRFNSTSGDLRIRRPLDAFSTRDAAATGGNPVDSKPAGDPQRGSTFAFGAIAWRNRSDGTPDAAAPSAADATVTPATDASRPAAGDTGTADVEADDTEATADSSTPDDWQPEASDAEAAGDRRADADASPAADSAGTGDAQAELDVLRAVERGELTVEEAAARLEELKGASRVR